MSDVKRNDDGSSQWDCGECGDIVYRFYGQANADCSNCGACYNASGQRLRDNWRNNYSNYDDEIGDMEGYEMELAGDW